MNVKLIPWQIEVAKHKARFKIICAGRRAGKSVLARMMVLHWAAKDPGLYWIVSPTYKQSKQIHWREIVKEIPLDWVKSKNEVELSITLHNGSIIELKGAENPDSLRGVKLKGLIVDEIASIRNWDWLWKEVLRATLTDYEAPAIFISTPKGYNHFYDLYKQGENSDQFKSWKFTSYDNPRIPKSEIDQAAKDLNEAFFAQEYMADFRQYTGLVYKDFDRKEHVKVLPDFKPVYWIRGLDRGFRNPTAVAWIAVDKDGIWYQTEEIYKTEYTIPKLVPLLKQQRGATEEKPGIIPELSTGDSAQASDLQELSDMGEDFLPVSKQSGEKHQNYVEYKISKLSERLKEGEDKRRGYYVHPNCVNTIKEFETYRWKTVPTGAAQDVNKPNVPEKANDHMMDALGDLNVYYFHDYVEKVKKPWHGKMKGTYIPPAYEEEESTGWGSSHKTEWDHDPFSGTA